MSQSATIKSIALMLLLGVFSASARPSDASFNDVDGPNVRVLRHQDGSRTHFTRTPDNRTLTKRRYSANGVLIMLTVYRMDANGNPVACRISDGQGQTLFKVSYGYRKSDGQLVEERMFDARTIRKDPHTGKEMPIQRICYIYDEQGNRSAPIVYNLLPPKAGQSFEELFGTKSSALEQNPFRENKGAVNPNARPVGER
ncbi:MAG: hypothetical protein ACO3RV_00315 [Luteolibacter sp.]